MSQEDIHENKIFIVNFSELRGRLDPKISLYNRKVLHFAYPKAKLKALLLNSPQYGANESGISRKSNEEPRYIRITDIDENGLISTNELGATAEIVEDKYLLHENDILFARSGATVGKTYIHKDLPYKCFFAGYLIRFVIDPQITIPDYVFIFTQLNIYKEWVNAIQRPSGQPNINAEEYQSLEIPLPDIKIQKKLVNIYLKSLSNKQQKEQEAKDLLNSIDDYLLSELGIERPSPIRTENGRFFYTSFHNLMGSEWAPLCIKNNGRRSKSTLYKEVKLSTIATIAKGQAITSKEIVSGNYPVIAGGQSSPYSHNQYNYKGNIITISASGAYSGYVWYHNYPIFASDCSVIFSNDENVYLTKYIYEILRLRQQEIYLLQKGAGQPHVYPSDIANLTIPAIPLEKQQDIVAYCQELRNKAELLQKEGRDIIITAKDAIEQMIIGN